MKIKKGDKVIVITGKDSGKTGAVVRAFPKLAQVLIEGVNVKKKHQKPRGRGSRKGQVLEKNFPIHVSNVMLIDPKSGKGTRVGIKREKGGRIRIATKSKAEV
ncbi:50S ribosomal protein L24 [Candidatus Kaiserbacteria bacterium RIFCSPHIGHO2_01_FULL_48_10]|uniref:Large ribosomal subunit protein uL24 n=1 Tax=Candidatus Kaiserbacteria bacterium RIFCSPHIGHO2_01_FULL_48_10 TaxID=1798476 RepID=A0A1F6C687_9BACT|nr:MAG: 50S ribosomal protein L24 [Candidatus Kaiserbacteria bacterium RIFCSPHIGHO2_01_FULL_48_10]